MSFKAGFNDLPFFIGEVSGVKPALAFVQDFRFAHSEKTKRNESTNQMRQARAASKLRPPKITCRHVKSPLVEVMIHGTTTYHTISQQRVVLRSSSSSKVRHDSWAPRTSR